MLLKRLGGAAWFVSAVVLVAGCRTSIQRTVGPSSFYLVIHGGAGVLSRSEMTPAKEAAYRAVLKQALETGRAVLATNGTSLDAVSAAIRVMEDSPLFNAGKGAVLNHEGFVELDAALMDGATRRAGAVAGVRRVKNPVDAARAVMDRTTHVLLVGAGADAFAEEAGLKLEPPEYFITDERRKQWEEVIQAEKRRSEAGPGGRQLQMGTVGAVALDRRGNLAAGTSTGGLAGKKVGRVGDSPIIGAGTFADNATCAVSATGHGESFIRYGVAHDIAALMEYKKLSLEQAARLVVKEKLVKIGGEGGIIAIDRRGNIAMPFNSEGMYRGYIAADGQPHIAIYPE